MGRMYNQVNNAGIQMYVGFVDNLGGGIRPSHAVNLRSPFMLAQGFARHLRDSERSGRIIKNSSVHDELSYPTSPAIAPTKAS